MARWANIAGRVARGAVRSMPWAVGGGIVGAGAGGFLANRWNTGRTQADSDRQVANGMFTGAMIGAAALALGKGGSLGIKAWKGRSAGANVVAAKAASGSMGGTMGPAIRAQAARSAQASASFASSHPYANSKLRAGTTIPGDGGGGVNVGSKYKKGWYSGRDPLGSAYASAKGYRFAPGGNYYK